MGPIRREDLEALLDVGDAPCLTMYVPMVQAGPQTRQNPIRFHNALRRAEELLAPHAPRPAARRALVAPLAGLLEDEDFWQHQLGTLVVARSPSLFRTFRLPEPTAELVNVGPRFHVLPLLEILERDRPFRVLALSMDRVRLYDATRWEMRERPLPEGIPTSMIQALGPQVVGPMHRYYANYGRPTPAGRDVGPVGNLYHVQGFSDAGHKRELRKFFTLLDRGVFEAIRDKGRPVVLAGVDYLLPIYRSTTALQGVLDEAVTGNPDELGEAELHARAWSLVEPWAERAVWRALERLPVLRRQGRASHDLREILPAAFDGRVDTLLVERGRHRWGTYDPDERTARVDDGPNPENVDLLDLAAERVWRNRGRVHVVDPGVLPLEGEPQAALYRY